MKMYITPRFAISTCTAQYGRYIPVRQVTSTRTSRYWAVPPKIDRQRLISAVDGRLKKKSLDGGLEPYRKSESVPEVNNEPVKIVVAKSLQEIVFSSGKNGL
ncbi:hypothetical protein GW17_00015470 [Ensete ventricosum]|nr:hypothetical protein GW17_00015470 [Ensete ventricosum]